MGTQHSINEKRKGETVMKLKRRRKRKSKRDGREGGGRYTRDEEAKLDKRTCEG